MAATTAADGGNASALGMGDVHEQGISSSIDVNLGVSQSSANVEGGAGETGGMRNRRNQPVKSTSTGGSISTSTAPANAPASATTTAKILEELKEGGLIPESAFKGIQGQTQGGEEAKKVLDKNGNGEKEVATTTWGKTPDGTVFQVPPTHDFLFTMLSTLTTSHLTWITLFTLLLQPTLFFLLPRVLRGPFFLVYFAFWRASYDAGLGYVLRKQSEKKWIVRKLKSWGWLHKETSTAQSSQKASVQAKTPDQAGIAWANWWKKELEAKLGAEGYRWDAVPDEFNAWLVFRQLVDIILLNDFLSYCLFAISFLHFPANQSVLAHIGRWIVGWTLILFNLWVKIDAHRVVKDYAWYWGDAFWLIVQQEQLVFDGVYEISPHPMYSVGYAAYYGLSIVTGSYVVFFVSLVAHAAQFAFLLWFENPHIERTYGGGRKPITVKYRKSAIGDDDTEAESPVEPSSRQNDADRSERTPSHTEGETETEDETLATPQLSMVDLPSLDPEAKLAAAQASSAATESDGRSIHRAERPRMSMYELTTKYLQKPTVIFWNIDLFRASDFAFVLLVAYAVLPNIFNPVLNKLPRTSLACHFLHALAWRLFHSFGLGLLLRAQSNSKWLVRHFLKHYHYSSSRNQSLYANGSANISEREMDANDTVVQSATQDAFNNWKVLYNISLVMTYVSFGCLSWKIYSIPIDWTVSGLLLRHILGFALIALHVWAATSSYEVLGDYGWLYSDFFLVDQYPSKLAYTGIYRFLLNPERSIGGATFLGLSLISGSWMVATLAVISHLSHWWFLTFVEGPHMKRLYGDRLRKDGGLSKTMKNVVGKHAKALETRAGKHAPELKRVVSEVKGTLDKVEGRVFEAVEDFIQNARPRFQEVVQDTKILIQQSRERMIITRVASDMSGFDASQYMMTLPSSSVRAGASHRFVVGQPIRVFWNAPTNHSRKDWIGIYRLGSCRSELVTKISSMGKWRPLYDEEWDGDEPLDDIVPKQRPGVDAGVVVFDKDYLPWTPGKYELRLHHDGKHNVMTRLAPIEIFVNKIARDADHQVVREEVSRIAALAVDLDKKLVPKSSLPLTAAIRADLLPELREVVGDPASETVTVRDRRRSLNPSERESESESASASDFGDDHGKFDQADASSSSDDPDDFVLMDERQAKRIASLLQMTFDVDLATDVIIADANVEAITQRVLGARSLAKGSKGDTEGD